MWILLFLFTVAGAQVPPIMNPSFEGTTGVSVNGQSFTPNFYQNCCGGFTCCCSDVCPSGSVTLIPSDGTAYAGSGAVMGIGQEGITQSVNLNTGAYQFLIDLAAHIGSPQLQIWGGSVGCQQGELLWTSPAVAGLNWTTYQVSFSPMQNHTQISFYCFSNTSSGSYILYDHIRTGVLFYQDPPEIQIDSDNTGRPTRQPRRYDLLGRQL